MCLRRVQGPPGGGWEKLPGLCVLLSEAACPQSCFSAAGPELGRSYVSLFHGSLATLTCKALTFSTEFRYKGHIYILARKKKH